MRQLINLTSPRCAPYAPNHERPEPAHLNNGFTSPYPVTYKQRTMSEIAAQPAGGSSKPVPATPKPFTPEDETNLRETLKRCSPSTFEAAVQFRKTGNAEHVPAVVIGVIERFVEPELRTKMKDAGDD